MHEKVLMNLPNLPLMQASPCVPSSSMPSPQSSHPGWWGLMVAISNTPMGMSGLLPFGPSPVYPSSRKLSNWCILRRSLPSHTSFSNSSSLYTSSTSSIDTSSRTRPKGKVMRMVGLIEKISRPCPPMASTFSRMGCMIDLMRASRSSWILVMCCFLSLCVVTWPFAYAFCMASCADSCSSSRSTALTTKSTCSSAIVSLSASLAAAPPSPPSSPSISASNSSTFLSILRGSETCSPTSWKGLLLLRWLSSSSDARRTSMLLTSDVHSILGWELSS
mmetsp:Transcript_41107/g.102681  ORF Transcript_41107/g.102681 Transcript_41107/m.102681 type:complete len:276 (-) Transcript_41107:790-1617(-)